MSSFKVEFTLKQHTPLIHFQSNQSGATLRATELKPKLDRFLIENVFNNEKERYKEFLIKGQEKALDYKVKIQSDKNLKKFKYKTFISKKDKSKKNIKEGSYFGEHFAIGLKDTKVEIRSLHIELLSIIKNHFVDFLLITNFGTRQNKGFGSFSVEKINGKDIKLTKDQIVEKIKKYKYIIKTQNDDNPLKKIKNIYQVAKSGVYKQQKSKLMLYFKNKHNIRWEKRWIKRRLYELSQNNNNAKILYDDLADDFYKPNNWDFNANEKYFFVRAILGLAENYTFITNTAKALSKEKKYKEAEKKKILISIQSQNDIQRFKSPITFKVVGNDIFIFSNKKNIVDNTLKNSTFTFTASYKDKQNKVKLGELNVVDINDTELLKIFQNIFNNNNNSACTNVKNLQEKFNTTRRKKERK